MMPDLQDGETVEINGSAAKLRLPIAFKNASQMHLADFIKNEEADYWCNEWALRWVDAKPKAKS